MGSYLTLGSELSKKRHRVTKQETLFWRGAWAESRRVKETWRTLSCGWQSWVYGDAFSFQIVSGQRRPIILIQGPSGGVCLSQPRWIPVRRILEAGHLLPPCRLS